MTGLDPVSVQLADPGTIAPVSHAFVGVHGIVATEVVPIVVVVVDVVVLVVNVVVLVAPVVVVVAPVVALDVVAADVVVVVPGGVLVPADVAIVVIVVLVPVALPALVTRACAFSLTCCDHRVLQAVSDSENASAATAGGIVVSRVFIVGSLVLGRVPSAGVLPSCCDGRDLAAGSPEDGSTLRTSGRRCCDLCVPSP
jgi:hypothetical protein